MPRKKPPADPATRLASLPHLPDLVLAGGIRPIALYFVQGRDIVQPKLCLWMEPATSIVRSVAFINPTDDDETGAIARALDAFVTACTAPAFRLPPRDASPAASGKKGRGKSPGTIPGLPARVLVTDVTLAEAVREALTPLGVPVEYAEEMPAFDALFDEMAVEMGADPNAPPPQPYAWEMDSALLLPLYKAAASLWRRAPWDYLLDHPPIAVALGEHGPVLGVETLYASMLGALGEVFGVALYFSAEDFRLAAEEGGRLPDLPADADLTEFAEMLRQAGAPIDQVSPALRDQVVRELFAQMGSTASPEGPVARQNSLAVLFEDSEEADPTYYNWIKDHKLSIASREALPLFLRTSHEAEPRQPGEREARAITLALDALNHFFSKTSRLLGVLTPNVAPVTQTVQLEHGAEKIPITLTFPAPGFTLDEARFDAFDPVGAIGRTQAPERPVSEAAKTTLYRFKVEVKQGLFYQFRDIWRRVELRGDQTLHDLHMAIQQAFDFDNDHLYAFFLSNRAWDEASEYVSPFSDGERDSLYPLESLSLTLRKRFLYLFDYGDEWHFSVTLEAITPGAVQPRVRYPGITEKHGEAPPQYPDFDEEEGDDGVEGDGVEGDGVEGDGVEGDGVEGGGGWVRPKGSP